MSTPSNNNVNKKKNLSVTNIQNLGKKTVTNNQNLGKKTITNSKNLTKNLINTVKNNKNLGKNLTKTAKNNENLGKNLIKTVKNNENLRKNLIKTVTNNENENNSQNKIIKNIYALLKEKLELKKSNIKKYLSGLNNPSKSNLMFLMNYINQPLINLQELQQFIPVKEMSKIEYNAYKTNRKEQYKKKVLNNSKKIKESNYKSGFMKFQKSLPNDYYLTH